MHKKKWLGDLEEEIEYLNQLRKSMSAKEFKEYRKRQTEAEITYLADLLYEIFLTQYPDED